MIEGGASVGEEGSPARSHAEGLVAVRVSRPDEMLLIRQLAKEFHRESRYGHIPFSERKFKKHFLQTLNNPDDTLGAYVRHGDKVVFYVPGARSRRRGCFQAVLRTCSARAWPYDASIIPREVVIAIDGSIGPLTIVTPDQTMPTCEVTRCYLYSMIPAFPAVKSEYPLNSSQSVHRQEI